MSRSAIQHPIETAAEWLAPAVFGLSAGWAAMQLKVPELQAGALAVVLFAAAFAALRVLGASTRPDRYGFQPAAIEPAEPNEREELLLREEDRVLVLDDPLVEPAADSRVVQLFAIQEPTPGELVDKITEFLGEGRRQVVAPEFRPAGESLDASAALHSALANIRASLR
jgi:hypothetical protein